MSLQIAFRCGDEIATAALVQAVEYCVDFAALLRCEDFEGYRGKGGAVKCSALLSSAGRHLEKYFTAMSVRVVDGMVVRRAAGEAACSPLLSLLVELEGPQMR